MCILFCHDDTPYWTALKGFVIHHTHHSEGKVCGDRVNLMLSGPCVILSAVSGYWHIFPNVMGGIA